MPRSPTHHSASWPSCALLATVLPALWLHWAGRFLGNHSIQHRLIAPVRLQMNPWPMDLPQTPAESWHSWRTRVNTQGNPKGHRAKGNKRGTWNAGGSMAGPGAAITHRTARAHVEAPHRSGSDPHTLLVENSLLIYLFGTLYHAIVPCHLVSHLPRSPSPFRTRTSPRTGGQPPPWDQPPHCHIHPPWTFQILRGLPPLPPFAHP